MSRHSARRSPRLANRLLERFCRPERYEEIRGDLEEVYRDRLVHLHPVQAWLWYWVEVLFCFRVHFRRRVPHYDQARGPIMWKNYGMVALRTMRRHATYTGINITGLAIGIACCILIMAFIRHEWSYDTFHAKKERLYRVIAAHKDPAGDVTRTALSPAPLGPALVEEYPGIVRAARFMQQRAVVQVEDQAFQEELMYTDAATLEMFSFPLLRGDPQTALDDLHAIVLTASMAEKYFGETDPVGRTVQVESGRGGPQAYRVTGVVEDPPSHSSIDFDFLLRLEPHSSFQEMGETWGSSFLVTYVEVGDPGLADGFDARSVAFVKKYLGERLARNREQGRLSRDDDAWRMQLQPIEAVHMDPEARWSLVTAGNPMYSYVLAGIAVLVLVIGCINFVTLALARARSRAREVGVRKVVGAVQTQVMRQFWGEAFLMTLLAFVLGVGLAVLFLPTFNTLADKSLDLSLLLEGPMLIGLVGLLLVVGLAAGGYPGLVLARYRPVDVLKGGRTATRRHRWSRTLVVVQFTLSVALIVNTLVMTRQLEYMATRDLGYDTEQVAVLRMLGDGQQAQQLREILRQGAARRDDILAVSSVNNAFSRGWMSTTLHADGHPVRVYWYLVDYDFIELMGLDLIEGRSFSRDHPGDHEAALIVNEALMQAFGAQGQVGEHLDVQDDSYPIIGAVRDFHAFSLHQAIEPAMIMLSESYSTGNLLVKIRPGDVAGTLAFLEAQWKQVFPDKPFDFVFQDEAVQQQYEADIRWSTIVRYAAFLAILIACLGLFGLTVLSVTQRTKEIGIRKVLGASGQNLVMLLARQFMLVVALSTVLAAPLAFYAMQRWLADFAYRVEIGVDVFFLAGGSALLIALLTISYHVIRATRINPAEVLRHE